VISGWNQVLQTRVVARATKMKGFRAAMGERFIKPNRMIVSPLHLGKHPFLYNLDSVKLIL
jgi:hypothetical protein